jgi:hypothetical protein
MLADTPEPPACLAPVLQALGETEAAELRAYIEQLRAENVWLREQLQAVPRLRRVPVVSADMLNLVDRPSGSRPDAT